MTGPALEVGSGGEAVLRLQERLRALRLYDGEVDGSFGERTLGAVSLMRAHAGEPGDGPVDDRTWMLLDLLERTVEIADPFLEPDDASALAVLPADDQWRWDGDRWQPGGGAPGVGAPGVGAPGVGAHVDGWFAATTTRSSAADAQWVWDGDRWRRA